MRVMYNDQGKPEAFFYTGSNYSELWDFAREYVLSMNDVVYLKVSNGLAKELKPGTYVVMHADGTYRAYSQIEFNKVFVQLA